MRHVLITLFAVGSLLSYTSQAGTIFKCKSASGALLYQEKPCAEENKSLSSWGSASGAPLIMKQGDHGHYFVDGSINEHKLNLVIDTGASFLSLPQSAANAAGLVCLRQVMTHTANGVANSCTTIVQTFKFGSFTLKNVEAIITPNLAQPLLGMNILKQFRVEQDAGEMKLSIK